MDIPTWQSYVAAVVLPSERTSASGLTNLARNVFWAVGSCVAGLVMQNLAFSAPFASEGESRSRMTWRCIEHFGNFNRRRNGSNMLRD
jgi:hypothetical protein